MTNLEWFFSENDEKSGPFSTETMIELIDGGKIIAHTLVWKEGYEHWIKAYTCSEFETHLQRTSPPPLPAWKEGEGKATNGVKEQVVPNPKESKAKLSTKIVLASLATGIVIAFLQGEFYSIGGGIGFAIGSGISLFVIAFLIAAVLQGLYWVFKRRKMPGFSTMVWGIWIVVSILAVYGSLLEV